GKIVSMYLIIYSIGRFMVEFFRNDLRGNVGLLSTSQFIAVFTLILGLVIFNFHKFFKGAKK
ncbi:prolipoprotein diacylglyceryl transferase family protein, partial [Clostridium cagae]